MQGMSVTTAKQRLTTKTATTTHTLTCSPSVSSAHIVGFRVVHRVDLVLRVVNGVLVAVIVHSICMHISHRDNACFEVLPLHTPSVTIDRRQL